MRRALAVLLTLALPKAAVAQSLDQRVAATLAEAGPGVRFGLVVTAEDGKEIVAIDPDRRFIPASNTKIFTTAAAFGALDGLANDGAGVRIDQGDVILAGRGDAWLSSAADCVRDCLATLADAVAARTRRVRDVVGDDTLYPDERWSPGMSWNNIPTRSGTAMSALTLDDNELRLTVTPGLAGAAPLVAGVPYYTIDNRALTVSGGATALDFVREPNRMTVRLTGTIAAGAPPATLRLGIDDPAHYAAWTFRRMLRARGVRVTGAVQVRHRPLSAGDDPARRNGAPSARPPHEPMLATLTSPPLAEDLTLINKVSQNLHAELMLRRVGHRAGGGSIADGQAAVRAMLADAGVPRAAYDLADGSGMSSYNRVSPRGVATLLRWAALQPWGPAFRATLPIGGVDGTLARRFGGTILAGKLFAKTGSLNATSALAGYMIAKSGRTLTFAAYANDVPEGVNATKAMDAALLLVAEAN